MKDTNHENRSKAEPKREENAHHILFTSLSSRLSHIVLMRI